MEQEAIKIYSHLHSYFSTQRPKMILVGPNPSHDWCIPVFYILTFRSETFNLSLLLTENFAIPLNPKTLRYLCFAQKMQRYLVLNPIHTEGASEAHRSEKWSLIIEKWSHDSETSFTIIVFHYEHFKPYSFSCIFSLSTIFFLDK